MKKQLLLVLMCTVGFAMYAQPQTDSVTIRKLYDAALTQGQAYKVLEHLTTKIGARLSGSAGAQQAVYYMKQVMEGVKENGGFSKVILQPCKVPHWVRGPKEEAHVTLKGKKQPLAICALGGSSGTGPKGIKAQAVEVQTLADLAALGEAKLKGKIVFFNRPMDAKLISTGQAYGGAGDQRRRGPVEALKYGAAAVLVRSLTTALDDYPHTGSTGLEAGGPKLPAAALSTLAANRLSATLKADPAAEVYIKMNPETLPDADSYNVIGEITGSEKPDEIILVGGHLDSWDLAQGAHDDGTGCVQAFEVLRLFRVLGIQPKRTLRAVMFMNEENGLRGALKYAEEAKAKNEKHIAAIESDAGGFTPRGFGISTEPAVFKGFQAWAPLLKPYNADMLVSGGGGADIGPLRAQGTTLIGYMPDGQRYFDHHHTAIDRFEYVNRRELELGAATMAALVYLIDKYGLP